MRRKIWGVIGMVLISTLILSGCKGSENAAEETKPEIETEAAQGETAESADENAVLGTFEAVTLDGESVTESIFSEGDLTMVNIWGSFCSPCINEMPELGEISAEYADKGVKIVGIISDVYEAGDETALDIVKQTGADYTHLVLGEQLYNNYLNQVQVVPTTLFLDKEGRQVGKVYTGAKDKSGWTSIIEELLEQVQK